MRVDTLCATLGPCCCYTCVVFHCGLNCMTWADQLRAESPWYQVGAPRPLKREALVLG